jgi:hypothetical protein
VYADEIRELLLDPARASMVQGEARGSTGCRELCVPVTGSPAVITCRAITYVDDGHALAEYVMRIRTPTDGGRTRDVYDGIIWEED